MDHKYNYSITKMVGELTLVLDTDDRAFAYEFVHGMPEIVSEPTDTVNGLTYNEALENFKNNMKRFSQIIEDSIKGK